MVTARSCSSEDQINDSMKETLFSFLLHNIRNTLIIIDNLNANPVFSSQFPVSPPGPGSRKLLALPTWRLGDQVLGHKEMVRL